MPEAEGVFCLSTQQPQSELSIFVIVLAPDGILGYQPDR